TGTAAGKFYWASEVKALAGEMAGDGDLSRENLQGFLAKGFLEPPLTYYRNIRQIAERSALLLDLATLSAQTIEVYRPGDVRVCATMTFQDAKEEFKTELARAVAARADLAGGK